MGRRRFLAWTIAAVLGPLLSGCRLTAKPQPAPPTSTPRPTATATPTAAAIRPSVPALPASPTPTAGSAPTTLPAPRGIGQLLYTGTLDSTRGIILASGDARRLLAAGSYERITWAPDSARFAAIAASTPAVPNQQIVLFAADGRTLARFVVPLSSVIISDLLWSPDARHLLCGTVVPMSNLTTTLVAGEDGLRELSIGERAMAWRWTPGGRLAYLTSFDGASLPSPASPLAVWTVNATGEGARKEVEGAFWPLDWSADGGTLYALGGFRPGGVPPSTRGNRATTLLALDPLRGSQQVLVDVTAGAPGGVPRWIEAAAFAPASGLLALWRGEVPTLGTPTDGAGAMLEPIVVDAAGRELAQDVLWQGYGPGWFAWSRDGRRLAYTRPGAGGLELRVLDIDTDFRVAYPVAAAAARSPVSAAWSQDSRWLAYADGTDLVIAAAGEQRVYLFAHGGASPAWRPVR
jgi:Tol biopolymer transport system component